MSIEEREVILSDPNRTSYVVAATGEQDDDGNLCCAECIFDGAVHGQYMVNAVVELARSLGWDGQDSAEDIEAAGDGPVLLVDTCIRAEDYLDRITPDGWSFGWSDGDFFLANAAWWSIDG